jgi:hypothetical protein
MGAFEAGAVRNPRHAVVLARQVKLEVDALEFVARIAQRLIQRDPVMPRRFIHLSYGRHGSLRY